MSQQNKHVKHAGMIANPDGGLWTVIGVRAASRRRRAGAGDGGGRRRRTGDALDVAKWNESEQPSGTELSRGKGPLFLSHFGNETPSKQHLLWKQCGRQGNAHA